MKRMIASWTASALVLGLFSASASAMTVVYGWSPEFNSGGTGTLTISDPGITDPANFSGISESALVDLSYQWNHGATLDFASIETINLSGGWEACNGTLISPAVISGHSGTTSLQISASTCDWSVLSINAATAPTSESNWGYWTYSHTVVPVPAAVWLLGSALGGLGMIRRRQKAAA
ncbi:MAG: VPLPA-CTERM sorting domain-containing protein [Gammaproteobacteria bacterium]|nr:VPLPA-CTERM sorting domain-containing protein [Gammaproteobacteria bacterium]